MGTGVVGGIVGMDIMAVMAIDIMAMAIETADGFLPTGDMVNGYLLINAAGTKKYPAALAAGA